MSEYALLAVGLVFLVKGADYLVEGASSLAKRLGMSTLIIGLTIVAFGTSMPELIVNIVASIQGSTEVAFGNVIGSNIANILLVLGVTAVLAPIKVRSSTIWKEIPFALLSVAVLFVAANQIFINGRVSITENVLTRGSGMFMLLFFMIFLYYALDMALKSRAELETDKTIITTRSYWMIFLLIVGGLVGLYFGGNWTVESAVVIARSLGLSQFLISATIIAIGTSLPELVTAIAAAKRSDVDLAVGNAVGSNIFNVFWILGVTAVISPIAIPSFVNLDILVLFLVTSILFLSVFLQKDKTLSRREGVIFLVMYAVYIIFIVSRG